MGRDGTEGQAVFRSEGRGIGSAHARFVAGGNGVSVYLTNKHCPLKSPEPVRLKLATHTTPHHYRYITREAEIFDLNLHKLATQAQSQLLGELAKEKASEEAVSSATKHRTRPASHRYEKLVDGMKAAGGKSGLG